MFHLAFAFSDGEASGGSIAYGQFIAQLIFQNNALLKLPLMETGACHLAVSEGYSIR
jgi:hypothetical protein